ncbi:hypothetical protein DK26_15005 [Bosea sp. WAO]|uniref:hypothetical protein n=1 Tax=Bosea sp. WAO TaxID=406341 RepID=UPI0007479D7A|nr:hypothetical protein [Bosea sp. WAO]KUL94320.1 hypothetical protein DK26_15005 [Bosea sp. WAO]
MLEIVSPAADPNLLTVVEARKIVGLPPGDTSQDAVLAKLVARASADIFAACRIVRGQGAPRTLRQEVVRETRFFSGGDKLILARRHEITLAGLTISGSVINLAGCIVEGDPGLVSRTAGARLQAWPAGLVVVEYEAGFDEVPPDLAGVAADMIRLLHSAETRDPLVKSVRVDIPGVEEVETQYWVNSGATTPSSSSGLPADLMARLAPYRNATFA